MGDLIQFPVSEFVGPLLDRPQPVLELDDQLPTEQLFPCISMFPGVMPVMSQCNRSCSPDDCEAPDCYRG
jgi:hypothetical protein